MSVPDLRTALGLKTGFARISVQEHAGLDRTYERSPARAEARASRQMSLRAETDGGPSPRPPGEGRGVRTQERSRNRVRTSTRQSALAVLVGAWLFSPRSIPAAPPLRDARVAIRALPELV